MFDIYVINLKKRIDRLERIKKDFNEYNLIIVEAEEDKIGWNGCFKSHLKCISLAVEKQLDYIIVIEDDCKKSDNFDDNLKEILQYLKNNMNRWNIFLGGVTGVWNYTDSINLNGNLTLLNITEGKTFHFMIYNSNCYDFFLSQEMLIPIDKCWHKKLIGTISIPFLATQYQDYSDIENKQISYESRFINIEKNFLSMLKSKF